MTTDKLSILVMSCDRFEPVWNIFYTLFEKFWPAYDGKVFHYSENRKTGRENVIDLHPGLERSPEKWSEGLHFALDAIDSKYVILMLDDFFLNQQVDHEKVTRYLSLMEQQPDIKCLRLAPIPPADIPVNDELGKMTDNAPYRISTQMAIWNKAYLKQIAKIGETPWEFEEYGTKRSYQTPGEVWGLLNLPREDRVVSYFNSLIRGKMSIHSRKFLDQAQIEVDTKIPVNSRLEEYFWFGAPKLLQRILFYFNKNIFPIMWRNTL